jgi:hypothetical protein
MNINHATAVQVLRIAWVVATIAVAVAYLLTT